MSSTRPSREFDPLPPRDPCLGDGTRFLDAVGVPESERTRALRLHAYALRAQVAPCQVLPVEQFIGESHRRMWVVGLDYRPHLAPFLRELATIPLAADSNWVEFIPSSHSRLERFSGMLVNLPSQRFSVSLRASDGEEFKTESYACPRGRILIVDADWLLLPLTRSGWVTKPEHLVRAWGGVLVPLYGTSVGFIRGCVDSESFVVRPSFTSI